MRATHRLIVPIVLSLCAAAYVTGDNRWLASAVALGLGTSCIGLGRWLWREMPAEPCDEP